MTGLESLPLDLIAKILSDYPAKSIGKLRCVSKLWASTLSQSCFTDLFLTNSSARPRLLFSLSPQRNLWVATNSSEAMGRCCLSSPQPQNPDENTSIAVENSPIGLGNTIAPVSGLIFCPNDRYTNRLESGIGNPTTGQYVDLPTLKKLTTSSDFFVYDPIGKQYKILCMNEDPRTEVAGYLLTFPFEKNESWRSIECPTRYTPFSPGICINGILYYVGRTVNARSCVIVCFDVRSEKFTFIDQPEGQALGTNTGWPVCFSNFNGKLVLIFRCSLGGETSQLKLCVCVLEDEKKPEWSKHDYRLTLPFGVYGYEVGMIGTGEIVVSPRYVRSGPFYVYYFNPERNTFKMVKIQGIEAYKDHTVTIFLDHVENVSVIAKAKSYPDS